MSYYNIGTIEDVQYEQVIPGKNKYNPEAAKRIKAVMNNNNGSFSLLRKNEYTIKGAMIGGTIMLLYSLAKRRNILLFTAIGTITGGIITNIMFNKINKKDEIS